MGQPADLLYSAQECLTLHTLLPALFHPDELSTGMTACLCLGKTMNNSNMVENYAAICLMCQDVKKELCNLKPATTFNPHQVIQCGLAYGGGVILDEATPLSY